MADKRRVLLALAAIFVACAAGRSLPFVTEEEENALLDFHNARRACHDAPPLVWDAALAASAQKWAAACVFAHSRAGENLCRGYETFGACVRAWYAEARAHAAGANHYSPATGHFTQMVWRGTSKLGCGVRYDCPGGPLMVCHYDPPGNVVGRFTANVAMNIICNK